MVVLKRAYEKAVEARNFAGIQLIDRNDELCILWEKSNIQEKLLKRGEDAMLSKDEEVRILRIELCEVQRKLQVLHRRIPDVPKLGVEVQRLRSQLADVHKTANTLSDELEKPEGSLRKWRPLPGTDPDQETLSSKIQFLEERLNDKKEALLEKELVLEEVTTLSEKLRAQALEGRAGTLELSQKVNAFQGRIKDVTRKMMATVSELSMYQATAIKLEAESEVLGAEVERRERTSSVRGRGQRLGPHPAPGGDARRGEGGGQTPPRGRAAVPHDGDAYDGGAAGERVRAPVRRLGLAARLRCACTVHAHAHRSQRPAHPQTPAEAGGDLGRSLRRQLRRVRSSESQYRSRLARFSSGLLRLAGPEGYPAFSMQRSMLRREPWKRPAVCDCGPRWTSGRMRELR